jgi:hypothetical protein
MPDTAIAQELIGAFRAAKRTAARQVKAMLAANPSGAMMCWPVSARVGNVKK